MTASLRHPNPDPLDLVRIALNRTSGPVPLPLIFAEVKRLWANHGLPVPNPTPADLRSMLETVGARIDGAGARARVHWSGTDAPNTIAEPGVDDTVLPSEPAPVSAVARPALAISEPIGVSLVVPMDGPTEAERERQRAYARHCIIDSFTRGEAPVCSALLYFLPGVLDPQSRPERRQGINAELAIAGTLDRVVVCVDLGMSDAMQEAASATRGAGRVLEYRRLEGWT